MTHPRSPEGVPPRPTPVGRRSSSPTLPDLDPASLSAEAAVWEWSRLPPGEHRYRMGPMFARGGMGDLYAATDTVLARVVALKVLHQGQMTTPATVIRFLQESRIHAHLTHPGIPPVYDVGRLADGRAYLAMKLVPGRTLTRYLTDRPPADHWDEYRRVFREVCEALEYANSKGVVHRDLTPSNVIVPDRGRAQVIDWGLAKVTSPTPTPTPTGTAVITLPNLCETGEQQVLGTPGCIPPERVIGPAGATPREDVFGLGCTLCFVLTGTTPFVGHLSAFLEQIHAGDLTELAGRLRVCGGPPDLVALAAACLHPNPAERPQTVGEVCRSLAPPPPRRPWWARLFGRRADG